MKSYETEIFGPVLQIIIDSTEEGIKIINDNKFGNSCCIFTGSGESENFFTKCQHWNGRYKYTTSSSIIIS